MAVIASTEKVLTKILFRTNESYIIDSGNIGTQKAEYIIRHQLNQILVVLCCQVVQNFMFLLQNISVLSLLTKTKKCKCKTLPTK